MMDDLFSPPIPVMIDLVTPEVTLVANPFFAKQAGQPMGIV
jgi:hypothetical protein